MWVWIEPGQGTGFLGEPNAVGYLFVYTEMEGVASVAGRPPGSLPSRSTACTCSTALSSWDTVAVWKKKSRGYCYRPISIYHSACYHQAGVGPLAGTERVEE